MTTTVNSLFRATTPTGTIWTTFPKPSSDEVKKLFKEVPEVKLNIFEGGEMKLEDLPESTQEEVKRTLMAFNECSVLYYHGSFHTSTGCCIMSSYPNDHFVCGRYPQKEVYSEEQRMENFKIEFGYYPAHI